MFGWKESVRKEEKAQELPFILRKLIAIVLYGVCECSHGTDERMKQKKMYHRRVHDDCLGNVIWWELAICGIMSLERQHKHDKSFLSWQWSCTLHTCIIPFHDDFLVIKNHWAVQYNTRCATPARTAATSRVLFLLFLCS